MINSLLSSFKKKIFVLFYSLFQLLYKIHGNIFEDNQNVNIYI